MTHLIPRPHNIAGSTYYAYYTAPHDRTPRRVGEVVAILARPEHLPDAVNLVQDMEIEGDSHLAFCQPAVDINSPNRQLKFDLALGGSEVLVVGSANSSGFLGKLVAKGLAISDAYACETTGLQMITPILSLLSFENDIPLYIRQLHIKPMGVTQTFVRVMNLFRARRHGNRQHRMDSRFQHIASAYREGLNLLSFSPLFAFLCFHQVIEATTLTGIATSSGEKRQIPADIADVLTWVKESLNDDSLTEDDVRKLIPIEAFGRKYTWIQDRLRDIRNKIAHGAYGKGQPKLYSLDDAELFLEAQTWMVLARTFARRSLKDALYEVDLGLPFSLEMPRT